MTFWIATTNALMRLSRLAEIRHFLQVSTQQASVLDELAALQVYPEWEVALCIAASWHEHQKMLHSPELQERYIQKMLALMASETGNWEVL